MKNNKTAKKLAGRKFALILALAFALTAAAPAAGAAAAPDYLLPNNPDLTTVQAEKPIGNTQNYYLGNWAGVPGLQTIVNPDGTVSVLDADNAIVYEYSANAEFIRTQAFKKELDKVGAFTKDKENNYYIFYAKDVAESAHSEKNMALVKYSPSGNKLKEFWLEAETTGERWASGYSGVKIPFDAGMCKMEISGDMIAVYFARLMFVAPDGLNHQASYGFVLNLDTFERPTAANTIRMPSAGHSFNQFILPVEGGFVFADHGDSTPRAFSFENVLQGQPYNSRITSFGFDGESGENYTGAEMGGLAKTPNGYIFAGTYDKKNSTAAGSRNLFLLVMNEDLTEIGAPVWITDYTDKNAEHAVSPKIVRIDEARYLLVWEVYNPRSWDAEKTCMAIVSDKGEVITPAKEIPGVSLNGFDVLRYNPKTQLVHWATGGNGTVNLYSLDPYARPNYAPPLPIGTKLGDVVYSDITAYINGHEIPVRAANGKTLVVVEDLARYGFDVVWNGTAKTLKVEINKGKAFNPMTAEKDAANKPGAFRGNYVYTGIKTYLSGKLTGCVSINGQIYMDFETLKKYGKISWNGQTRELRLVIDR